MTRTKKVPPDGGYGWVIVFANALSNFIATPLMHCFGLIFNVTFEELGLTATQSSLIINLNAAFGMMTGLINGVLLKWYGCRKVAMLASFLLTLGVVLTSFSRTFTHFVISYGLITSLGMGLCQSAYGLAVYTYFIERRSYAIGLSETITGFGPILIPQMISVLMTMYTPEGVTLIFGGICAHVFIAAILLQPVERHMKTKIDKDLEMTTQKASRECSNNANSSPKTVKKDATEPSLADGSREMHRNDTDQTKKDKDLEMGTVEEPSNDASSPSNDVSSPSELVKRNTSEPSLTKEMCGNHPSKKDEGISTTSEDTKEKINREMSNHEAIGEKLKQPKSILRSIVTVLDLDLLKDPIFVNIMMGLALAIFAELNFTVLTPFMLHDYGLDTSQIAIFLSVLGGADIVFRFFAPHIGNFFTKPARWMYAYSLFLLMLTRFTFLLSKDFYILMVIALGLGIAKGVRKVYMSLVIPEYVSIDKLATASGMEMMMNGICIMIGGPLLGLVRDVTGSYVMCVVIMNCVTMTTITMWMIEVVIVKFKEAKRKNIKVAPV